MALGAKETACPIFSSYPSSSVKLHSFDKSSSSIRFNISLYASQASLRFSLYSIPRLSSFQPTKKHGFQLQASVESVEVEERVEIDAEEKVEIQRKPEGRRKLFVLNMPWSFSVADIKKLFGECGTVADVEIIKHKDGKNRGFAFVSMSSGEGALAAIERFDSYELVGRIIRVQFAKRFKKPIPTVPVDTQVPLGQTRHKLYVSNLPWKARSNNLREFFSSNFNPLAVRVVFDNPSGRSAGYGFVSFATKEEAESAISVLDGKELMGRPIRLKFSKKNTDASESKDEESSSKNDPDASESEEEKLSQQQPEES